MISVKEAGRLLRQDWKNPMELARELYAQVTSKSPKTVESPIEISVPRGQTALTLTRPPEPPRPSLAEQRGVILSKPRPAAQEAAQAPERKLRTSIPPRLPQPQPTAKQQPRRDRSLLGRIAPLVQDIILPPPTANPPKHVQLQPPPDSPPARVQSGPQRPLPKIAPAPQVSEPSFAKPYEAPLLEVKGETKFSGPAPVQFEQRPLLFNPITAKYEDFSFDPKLTKIPRETPYRWWFGQVTSRGPNDYNGVPQYNCDIFPQPNAAAKEDNVLVSMWGLESLNELDKGYQAWPILQSPVDGHFYCRPIDVNERLAQTTSAITNRVTTTAGTGTAQIYTMTLAGTVGTYVANKAGNVQVYSISGGTSPIPTATWIIIRKIFNSWHIVAADCSGAP